MKTVNILMGVVVAIGVVTVLYLYQRQTVFLVAKDVVPVFATTDDSMASPAPKPVAELTAQQSVSVLRCVDVKHYQVYKVRLPNGKTGYINVGSYDLLDKDGKPTSC